MSRGEVGSRHLSTRSLPSLQLLSTLLAEAKRFSEIKTFVNTSQTGKTLALYLRSGVLKAECSEIGTAVSTAIRKRIGRVVTS